MCQENSNNYWQLANVQEAAGKHSNDEVEENARVLKLLNLSNKFEFWRQKSQNWEMFMVIVRSFPEVFLMIPASFVKFRH